MDKAIYLDCFAGISGNMLLGAFLDLGFPEQVLREELQKLPLTDYELMIQRAEKKGISAVYVDVKVDEHHHHHRHLPDIFKIIDGSSLNQAVKDDAKKIFTVLAKAEAKVHGTTMDKIHFHEVGAVDSIIDIVGTAIALHYLGIHHIYASRLSVGSGFVKCSHGLMPVPAPATAELLQGIPYSAGDIAKELVTPTGAAVLAALGTGFGTIPEAFVSQSIGYGAGTWELDIPNVLRMHIGILSEAAKEQVMVLEANIDDLNPQIYQYVMDKLLEAGALDVWLTPIMMKKGRPATKLSVLLKEELRVQVENIIFRETSTIGLRYYRTDRTVAERKGISVKTQWGEIQVKQSYVKGILCNTCPEYEDCRRVAAAHHVPLKMVQQAAIAAALKEQ